MNENDTYIYKEELIRTIHDEIERRDGLATNPYEQQYEDGYLTALENILEYVKNMKGINLLTY